MKTQHLGSFGGSKQHYDDADWRCYCRLKSYFNCDIYQLYHILYLYCAALIWLYRGWTMYYTWIWLIQMQSLTCVFKGLFWKCHINSFSKGCPNNTGIIQKCCFNQHAALVNIPSSPDQLTSDQYLPAALQTGIRLRKKALVILTYRHWFYEQI